MGEEREACSCGVMDRAAAEPDSGVEFDPETNEFHIVFARGHVRGHHIIRYCYWCGGRAPTSRRGTLFAQVTSAETHRLLDLVRGLDTLDAVIAKLGPPDEDHPTGFVSTSKATDDEPSTSTAYRGLRYQQLSETAYLQIIDFGPAHGLRRSVHGKYLGRPKL